MDDSNSNVPELIDINPRTGKPVSWTPKKKQSKFLAYAKLCAGKKRGLEWMVKQGERMFNCGEFLEFAVSSDGERKLMDARFCSDRLCPTCAERKSKLAYHQLKKMYEWAMQREPGLVPLFLTLTVRNCTGEELTATLERISKGWRNFARQKWFKRQVVGYYRAEEITYNKTAGTYHPHVHVILLVRPGYFTSSDYKVISGEKRINEWGDAWQQALNLDYSPIVHVQKMKGDYSKAVAECAKYALKPGDFLLDSAEETAEVVGCISFAIKGHRFTSSGGILKEARRVLRFQDVEESDLIDIGSDKTCDIEIVAIQTFVWNSKLKKFVLKSERPPYPDEVERFASPCRPQIDIGEIVPTFALV